MEKQHGKIRSFFEGVWEYFLANILDMKGRLDTGRIGQFIGMVSLTGMSTWATWQLLVYKEAKGGMDPDRLKLFSIVAAFPLALASMKDFARASGTAVPANTRLPDTGFWGFIKRNLLDDYGRINIERIGHIFGMVNLAVIAVYLQYALYRNMSVDLALATTLSADSGFPMLLYRVKEWFAKKAPALVEATTKTEKEEKPTNAGVEEDT
jgi:hypothetical protein